MITGSQGRRNFLAQILCGLHNSFHNFSINKIMKLTERSLPTNQVLLPVTLVIACGVHLRVCLNKISQKGGVIEGQ